MKTLLLRRMGQTGSDIGGGGASLFVVLAMALTQLLSPVLEEFDQIEAVETEAAPVFDHPQTFTGPVEVGIDQPRHTWLSVEGDNHPFHGSLGTIACSTAAMDNGGSESPMRVLIWGILLLGSIGVFIVWGLTNAYPGSVI